MEGGNIVVGSERLYYALALAAKYSTKDKEWEYVRMRLDELTRAYEDLLAISHATGWPIPSKLDRLIDDLVGAVASQELSSTAKNIMVLDNLLESLLPVFRTLYRYVTVIRLAGALVEILAGLAVGIAASNTLTLALSLAVSASGIAAGMLYRLPLSDVLLALGGLLAVSIIVSSSPNMTIFASGMAAVIAALATAPLARFLSSKVANFDV